MWEPLNYTSKEVQREWTRWPAKDTVGDLCVWLEEASSSLMTSVTLADILVDYIWALVVSQIQWMISFSAAVSTTTKFSCCMNQPQHTDYSQNGRVWHSWSRTTKRRSAGGFRERKFVHHCCLVPYFPSLLPPTFLWRSCSSRLRRAVRHFWLASIDGAFYLFSQVLDFLLLKYSNILTRNHQKKTSYGVWG